MKRNLNKVAFNSSNWRNRVRSSSGTRTSFKRTAGRLTGVQGGFHLSRTEPATCIQFRFRQKFCCTASSHWPCSRSFSPPTVLDSLSVFHRWITSGPWRTTNLPPVHRASKLTQSLVLPQARRQTHSWSHTISLSVRSDSSPTHDPQSDIRPPESTHDHTEQLILHSTGSLRWLRSEMTDTTTQNKLQVEGIF